MKEMRMKEIIDVIHKSIYPFFDGCKNEDGEESLTEKDKLLLKVNKAICNNLKALEPKTEWISVSERLPEERGYYIVTEKVFSLDDREHKGRYNTMVEQVEYCNGKWQRASFFEVTAWMPLPKPYEPLEEKCFYYIGGYCCCGKTCDHEEDYKNCKKLKKYIEKYAVKEEKEQG